MTMKQMFLSAQFILAFTTLVYGFDLDEIILKDIIFPGSSKCIDEGSTDTSFVHTPTTSYWAPVNAKLEPKKFMAQMTHTDSDPNKSWSVRFGHGGDIYSMVGGGYGEAIPPQTLGYSVWVDEVTQAVAVDIRKNNCANYEECFYIHQAGTYFAERTFDDLDETFYSPNVAKYCEGNRCIFASWGQIAWVPTVHESDLIYVHQYRNCGNGVLEYTQMFIGYFGGQIAYLNMPWAGVRTSSLPDIYLSNTDFTMAPKEISIQNWGVNDKLLTLPETGGYTTFAQNKESDPDDNAALSYVHGICDEYSDPSNRYFRAPSRFRFGMSGRDFTVFTVNGRISSMSKDNSFVHRQFLISDSLGNISAQALSLYDEAYGDMLTPSDYNGRTLEIYSLNSNTFGVAAASDLGGSSTSCSIGTSVCVGSTVPTSGYVPFFTIRCGSSTYFGSNKYFFAPDRDSEERIRSYVCAGEAVGIVPELKMLGFFPENGMCNSLQDATYDAGFCDESTAIPTLSPTLAPSTSSTTPTVSPTETPVISPTQTPTVSPTKTPTVSPTETPSVSPTKTPTVLPTEMPVISPTQTPTVSPIFSPCSDSLFRFNVLHDDKTIRKSCSWVAKQSSLRCNIEGISSHCQQTCSSCNACVDSPFKIKFTYKGKNTGRHCDWAGRKDVEERCSIDGIYNTCELTCGSCTSSPDGTSLPTAAPSCSDSLYRFHLRIGKKIIKRSCSWVAKHPNNKCEYDGVSSHCPQTCSSCDSCTDSSLKFKTVLYNGDKVLTSCKWVGKNVKNRCYIGDITNTCRLTCEEC